MLTGIIEEKGHLQSRAGDRYIFAASTVLQDARTGDSIAVSGCCLTVVQQGQSWWAADISDETRKRTNLDDLVVGAAVNLERPVRLQDRLGGHLVQGHVDAVGTITAPAPDLAVALAPDLMRYVVEKGSIAVNGVSLTVVDVAADGFTVALIPHTMDVTNLGELTVGDAVNIEVDVMAKYAEKLLSGCLG